MKLEDATFIFCLIILILAVVHLLWTALFGEDRDWGDTESFKDYRKSAELPAEKRIKHTRARNKALT